MQSGSVRGQRKLTLSGVLNAIDGTTASEGRLLFMTASSGETLDKAAAATRRKLERPRRRLRDPDPEMMQWQPLRRHCAALSNQAAHSPDITQLTRRD